MQDSWSFLGLFKGSDKHFHFKVVQCCEGSKQWTLTNVKESDQFSWKNSHFQGVSSPAPFKEFKDLLEP